MYLYFRHIVHWYFYLHFCHMVCWLERQRERGGHIVADHFHNNSHTPQSYNSAHRCKSTTVKMEKRNWKTNSDKQIYFFCLLSGMTEILMFVQAMSIPGSECWTSRALKGQCFIMDALQVTPRNKERFKCLLKNNDKMFVCLFVFYLIRNRVFRSPQKSQANKLLPTLVALTKCS